MYLINLISIYSVSISFHLFPFICILSSFSFRLYPFICILSSGSFHFYLFIFILSSVSFHLYPFIFILSSLSFHLYPFIFTLSSLSFHLYPFIFVLSFMSFVHIDLKAASCHSKTVENFANYFLKTLVKRNCFIVLKCICLRLQKSMCKGKGHEALRHLRSQLS